MYKLCIVKRDYSHIILENVHDSNTKIICENQPLAYTGFYHGDIVSFEAGTGALILHERHLPSKMVGLLKLISTTKYKGNKRGVPSYMCVPLVPNYPKCILHSKVIRTLGNITNQFVLFTYTTWETHDVFPRANSVSILGSEYDMNAIEKAILYKMNLYPLRTRFSHTLVDAPYTGRVRINTPIYSIDPKGCRDIDDAYSIFKKDGVLNLDIHISDVFTFMEYNSLLENIHNTTSIYLNDSILHMIHSTIGTQHCSLIAGTCRNMISIKIQYNTITNNIDYEICPSYGHITKNYDYDTPPGNIHLYYKEISHIYYTLTGMRYTITDSHTYIEALMILYNYIFAKKMSKDGKTLVYRKQEASEREAPCALDPHLQTFMKIIQSNSAEYSYSPGEHVSIGVDIYTHATSPIRRVVDLMNQGLYYEDSTLIKRFAVQTLNTRAKTMKKYYRILDKIKLIHALYLIDYAYLECYIYDYHENSISLYFPKEKISIYYNIDIVSIKDTTITYRLNHTLSDIQMYTKHTVKVFAHFNIFNINASLWIEF